MADNMECARALGVERRSDARRKRLNPAVADVHWRSAVTRQVQHGDGQPGFFERRLIGQPRQPVGAKAMQ